MGENVDHNGEHDATFYEELEVTSGLRCPSCRCFWTWCHCSEDEVVAARAAYFGG